MSNGTEYVLFVLVMVGGRSKGIGCVFVTPRAFVKTGWRVASQRLASCNTMAASPGRGCGPVALLVALCFDNGSAWCSEADAAEMCRNIVMVVAHCHSLGVVHR
jgi:hypothetical protein